ncbi:MAG: hypothetical protein EXR72_01785 [Myxococcales bacterium]|nr:hypothetical protein [Myxococcales bacterium]
MRVAFAFGLPSLVCAALLGACGNNATPYVEEDFAMNPSDDGGAQEDGGGGGCSPACNGLTPHCNATMHCVGCVDDSHCAAGTFCKQTSEAIATCTPGCMDDKRCPVGSKCCNKSCVATATDPQNCGACGTACKGVHAQATCAAGKCALAGKCDSGWGDCNNNQADGCEANLLVDPNNCVTCGTKCAIAGAVSACANGCYAAACTWGFDDCNNNEMDGCETSVLMDGINCGKCGASCKKLPNAAAGCFNGACTLGKCDMGFYDCNGDAKDGCESSIFGDPKNCGKCGVTCPMNQPFCAMGVCGLQPPCKNPGGGGLVHDNGAAEKINYCYEANDTIEIRSKKACESHFGIGKCCVIAGGYSGMQYGACGGDGGNGSIHWHWDNHPNGHCDPLYVIGDVVSPGWCGKILGSHTK